MDTGAKVVTSSNCLPWLLIVACLLLVTSVGHAAVERSPYCCFDALGSPVAGTDSLGNVVWRETYQPYGERIQNQPTAQTHTRWYTGHPQDTETGLVYAGARHYDPVIGRFMGVDPAAFDENDPTTFNRYSYVGNNPYRYIDPDGKVRTNPYGEIGAGDYRASNATVGGVSTARPQAAPSGAGPVTTSSTGPAPGAAAKNTLQANRAAGDAFERAVGGELRATHEIVAPQITIRTPSGERTRVDFVTLDGTQIGCVECKSSATAPLTRNQAAAFPEIQQTGGVVVGAGKPGIPGGTVIPPGVITIRRP